VNAEKLLLNKGIKKIKKIMVDENPSHMDEMIKITGEKTVPQIFIGDQHIGGFEQLRSINNDGNLDKLILED
jgi:glutaredoxin 3